MAQSPGAPPGSRWHEWIIVSSILGLAAIGVASIWGGPIRRWIDSAGSERSDSARPGRADGTGGPRL